MSALDRPDNQPASWPEWVQRLTDPDGGHWRLKTIDLLLASTQFAPAEAQTIASTMGRFQTTIERPDGSLRIVYTADEEEAEDYHRRTAHRIQAGQL